MSISIQFDLLELLSSSLILVLFETNFCGFNLKLLRLNVFWKFNCDCINSLSVWSFQVMFLPTEITQYLVAFFSFLLGGSILVLPGIQQAVRIGGGGEELEVGRGGGCWEYSAPGNGLRKLFL